MQQGDREILERALEHETRHREHPLYGGWTWSEVRARPHTLGRLIVDGLITRVLDDGQVKLHRLTEEGARIALLSSAQAQGPLALDQGEVPSDLFESIIGYEDIKEVMRMIALEGKRVHVLLIGPPATSKSLFLMDLARLPGTYTVTGSRVTAAGLTQALELYRPRILVLDEVEKSPTDAMSVLLSVMESGLVTVTKFGVHDSFTVDLSVVGAANSARGMPPEFLSRFGFTLRLKPYEREEFVAVCKGFLSAREGVPPELAAFLGEAIWEQGQRDVRQARAVARMLKAQTREEVTRWVTFLKKYS